MATHKVYAVDMYVLLAERLKEEGDRPRQETVLVVPRRCCFNVRSDALHGGSVPESVCMPCIERQMRSFAWHLHANVNHLARSQNLQKAD